MRLKIVFLRVENELGTQDEALMERAEWCRRFAQINAVALRKVKNLRMLSHVPSCNAARNTPYQYRSQNGALGGMP